MADITLKAYLAHLDDLLTRRQYEEAEAHCKHILAKYPKNLAALKRLAKAQFEAGDVNAAEASYATILSMDPRSAEAYTGLSWVARQRGQGTQAIALLERAYEQDTNNSETVQLLHEAQRTFNDRTNAKLPQTQYIAARQQFRSGLAQQAVSTLNGALAADPARADIRLLKMQIYLQTGEGVEAARIANDVLKQLPDCIDANKMLAEFWKAQGRPSDAQRFVARIEAVEPYLAFEIATGAPPSDETLSLSLLNFRAAPSAATSTETPDWMGALGMSEPTETAIAQVNEESVAWLENAQSVIEEDSDRIDESWLADVPDMPEDLSWLNEPAAGDSGEGETGEDFDFSMEFGEVQHDAPLPPSLNMNWMDDAPPADEGDTLDSISTRMAQEEAKNAQVLGELSSLSPDTADTKGMPDFRREEDTLSDQEWMNAINVASTDPTTPDRQDFNDFLKNFTNFSDLTPESAAQSSGTGLTGLLSGLTSGDDAEDGQHDLAPVSPDVADIDPEDPLAWMRVSVSDEDSFFDPVDDEMPDLEALTGEMEPLADNAAAAPAAVEFTTDEDDGPSPYAWMEQHNLELIDNTPQPNLWDDPMGVQNEQPLDQADVDPLAWMRDAGIELDEEISEDPDPLAWAKESGVNLLEDVGTADFKQTASLSAEFAELGAAASETPSPIDEIATNQPPSARSGLLAYVQDEGAAQDGDSPMSDKDQPDWLNDPDDEDEAAEPAASGDLNDFDWMAITPSDNDSDIDWDAVPDSVASDEAAPDWLASLENPIDAAEVASLSDKDDPNIKDLWDDTAEDIATPDWMAALRDESSDEAVSVQAEDWIFSEGEAAKDEIAGASEDLLAIAKDEIAAAADAGPDWLNEIAAVEAASPVDAESDLEGALDWLSASSTSEQSVAQVDEPDFSAADIPLTTENAAADLDWMSTLVSDSADDVQNEISEAVSSASDQVEAEADGAMDWLNAVTDRNTPEAVVPESTTNWLDEDDGGDQTNAFVAHDSLDWLTNTADEDNDAGQVASTGGDFDFAAAEDAAADGVEPAYELSFLDEDEPTSDIATVELEGDPLPDWLIESKSENVQSKLDMDVPEEQLQVQGALSGEILDDADLLEAEPPIQETLNASAVNSPDWLNAMVPGLEIGGDALDEDDPVDESEFLNAGCNDFAWLNAVVDAELAPPVLAAPNRRASRYPFSEPPAWLANLREETQVSAPVIDLDADDDSLPDWLKFDDAETN